LITLLSAVPIPSPLLKPACYKRDLSLLSPIVSGISYALNTEFGFAGYRTEHTRLNREQVMAKKCPITGKGPMAGNNVSHANNKTKRRYLPNLQSKRFWLADEKRFVRLRITTRGMRIIDKHGIEKVLNDIKLREQATA